MKIVVRFTLNLHVFEQTHQKGPVGSEVQNWIFGISEMVVLSVQFQYKKFWNKTLHSQDMEISLMIS